MIHIPATTKEVYECKQDFPTSLVKQGKIPQDKKYGNNEVEYFKPKQKDRIKKALDIFNLHKYKITQIDGNRWRVKSQTDKTKFYYVERTSKNHFECECEDFLYRHNKLPNNECKHIMSIKVLILTVKRNLISHTEEVTPKNNHHNSENSIDLICPSCDSRSFIRYGTSHLKLGTIKQKYRCSNCTYVFTFHTDGFENMMYDRTVVEQALSLVFSGLSFRKAANHLTIFYGKKISHATLVVWMKKFTKIMKYYTDSLQPFVSDTWHADEMDLNVKDCEGTEKGKLMKMWNIFDKEKRFWIATHISQPRTIEEARIVFQKAKILTDTTPKQIITDGYPGYPSTILCEFPRKDLVSEPTTKHVVYQNFQHAINNNCIERLHCEIREKTRTMRGAGNAQSAEVFAESMRIFHNFIREHSSLQNRTPAEAAGIDLKLGNNKLDSLIRLSAQKYNSDHSFKIQLRKKQLMRHIRVVDQPNQILVKHTGRYLNETWLEIFKIMEKAGFEWKKIGNESVWVKQIDCEQNGTEENYNGK